MCELGLDVLDVDCGDGSYAFAAARAGAKAVGVDSSPAAVEAARQAASEADRVPTFQVGNADRLPFETERFDVVLAVTVLCFVADARGAVVHAVEPR